MTDIPELLSELQIELDAGPAPFAGAGVSDGSILLLEPHGQAFRFMPERPARPAPVAGWLFCPVCGSAAEVEDIARVRYCSASTKNGATHSPARMNPYT